MRFFRTSNENEQERDDGQEQEQPRDQEQEQEQRRDNNVDAMEEKRRALIKEMKQAEIEISSVMSGVRDTIDPA